MDSNKNIKKSLCVTCLSRHRTLFFVNEVEQLQKVFIDIQFGQHDKICWECKAMVKKMMDFMRRTYKAQEVLLEIAAHGRSNAVQTLSHLTKSNTKVISYNNCDRDPLEIPTFKITKPIKVELEHIVSTLPVAFESPKWEVSTSVAGQSTFEDCMSLVKSEQPEQLNEEDDTMKLDSKYKIIRLSDYDSKTGKLFSDFVKEVILTESELEQLRMRKAKHRTSAYKCPTCVESFKNKEALDAHNLKHSDTNGKFSCNICKLRMLTQKKLDEHTMMHLRCFECLVCAYRSLDFPGALKHYDYHHRTQILDCDDCDETFQTAKELKTHRQTHKAPKVCPECGKKYKSSDSLKKHMQNIHKGELTECPICHKKLRGGVNNMQRHIKIHDRKVNEAAFCVECCIQFKSLLTYRNHLKTSLKHVSPSDMKFECPHCEKRYGSAATFRSHMLGHTAEAKYKCCICIKAFKTSSRLREHISIKHEGKEKPRDNMCDICAKAFNNKATLRQHLNSHLGHRPYVCDVCSDTFSYSASLWTHKKLKHGKKPDRETKPGKSKKTLANNTE